MEPIRVLHILHSMNRGGAENAIMNYYRYIDRDKVQFDFLLTEPSKCQFEDEISRLGGKVYRVPKLTIKNPVPYLTGVWRFFKTHPFYQIVHSHTSSKSFFPLFLAKLSGIPIRISHSHNTRSEHSFRGVIRNILKKPLKVVATHYFACGEEAAIWLYGPKTFHSGIVQIVPNVIDTSLFDYNPMIRQAIRKELGLSASTVLLGCTARFSYQKNLPFLISVFEVYHDKNKDSILLLLGDGELRDSLIEMVRTKGIEDSVIFKGVVSNVHDFEQAMDFFILPSFNEGIPLSVIEAQVSGLRCFVSRSVPRETDKTGLVSFLPLESGPEFWAEQLLQCRDYVRRSYREALRSANYDAQSSSCRLEQFYTKVV